MTKSSSAAIPAILVGGREIRHLRVPKQTLPFGDSTVLARTLAAYLDGGVSEVILVLGYKADAVAAGLDPVPGRVRIVRNPLFDEGMGSFLKSGIRELPSDAPAFCVGLGDQPLLTADLVREFLDAFTAGGKKILVPVHQGQLGLPAFFDISIAEEISSLPPNGELWDILKRHGDEIIDHPTGYSAVLRSIEDQSDYHAMLKIAGLPIPEPPPPPPVTEDAATYSTGDPAAE